MRKKQPLVYRKRATVVSALVLSGCLLGSLIFSESSPDSGVVRDISKLPDDRSPGQAGDSAVKEKRTDDAVGDEVQNAIDEVFASVSYELSAFEPLPSDGFLKQLSYQPEFEPVESVRSRRSSRQFSSPSDGRDTSSTGRRRNRGRTQAQASTSAGSNAAFGLPPVDGFTASQRSVGFVETAATPDAALGSPRPPASSTAPVLWSDPCLQAGGLLVSPCVAGFSGFSGRSQFFTVAAQTVDATGPARRPGASSRSVAGLPSITGGNPEDGSTEGASVADTPRPLTRHTGQAPLPSAQQATPVPVPATLGLIALGLMVLSQRGRGV